jgi:hypothetical protein
LHDAFPHENVKKKKNGSELVTIPNVQADAGRRWTVKKKPGWKAQHDAEEIRKSPKSATRTWPRSNVRRGLRERAIATQSQESEVKVKPNPMVREHPGTQISEEPLPVWFERKTIANDGSEFRRRWRNDKKKRGKKKKSKSVCWG